MVPEILTAIPGPESKRLARQLQAYECRNSTFVSDDWPVFWRKAGGTNVWDVDGNRYLDLTSAFGVTGLGHSAPAVAGALAAQAQELLHAMGDVHPAASKPELCQRLSEITFGRWGLGSGKVIFGNSGFEAVEAALKTSILYSGKAGVISFTGAYHGLGFGALDAGGLPFFREPFRKQLKDFSALVPYPTCAHCPFGVEEGYRLEGGDFPNCSAMCMERLQDDLVRHIKQREIGCILVEPIQGRGGIHVPPRDFLRLLREVCDEYKLLLVVDEIFTGFNRTGRLFACEHSDVTPDIICLGKGLTGGFPMSACVGRADIMDAWPCSQGEALHTSTFLGNPLGCAMALASIEEHTRPDLAVTVRERGRKLREALGGIRACCPEVVNLRGTGLLYGLELASGNTAIRVVQESLKRGLLLLADGPESNVLSFTPPFGITDDEIEFVARTVSELLLA